MTGHRHHKRGPIGAIRTPQRNTIWNVITWIADRFPGEPYDIYPTNQDHGYRITIERIEP